MDTIKRISALANLLRRSPIGTVSLRGARVEKIAFNTYRVAGLDYRNPMQAAWFAVREA